MKMPRGGGGARSFRSSGGSFRGGSFGGSSFSGGSRGGGVRGGPTGFRMGSTRPSGTPFGRTGARRTVSRAPSGPYRHTYYRPHRRYYHRRPYWWYHRPWYWRWWHSPYWAGWWYRPWYYSPVLTLGTFIFIILLGFMLVPLILIPIGGGANQVNYRSTETLYFNEYWYEREQLNAGNDITFSAQSSQSLITFAIWDQPFENLPTTTEKGEFDDTFTLENDYYQYYSIFLRKNSVIKYQFTSSKPIDFFIADGDQLYDWNEGDNPDFDVYLDNVNADRGTYITSEAKDYYLVWYNEISSDTSISFNVDYTANNVIDFSVTDFYVEEVYSVSEQSFTVPEDGEWYFFIYFDPMDSPEESTEITFDVTYETGIASIGQLFNPVLIIIIVIIAILLVGVIVARKNQKKVQQTQKEKPKITSPYSKKEPGKSLEEKKVSEESTINCLRCGAKLQPGASFCVNCGGKVEGRDLVKPDITTPANSTNCTYCGNAIEKDSKYCSYCGVKIEK